MLGPNQFTGFLKPRVSLSLGSCTPVISVIRASLKVCTFSRIYAQRDITRLGFAEAGRCCPYLLRPEILSSVLYKTVEYSEWTGLLGRKSSPARPQKRKYSTSAQGPWTKLRRLHCSEPLIQERGSALPLT